MESPRGSRTGSTRKVSFATDADAPVIKRSSVERCRNPACEEMRDIVAELRLDNKKWQAEVLRLRELLTSLGHPDRSTPSHSPRGSSVSSPSMERRKSLAKDAASLVHNDIKHKSADAIISSPSDVASTSSTFASPTRNPTESSTQAVSTNEAPAERRRSSCTGVDGVLPPPEELFERVDPRFRSGSEVSDGSVIVDEAMESKKNSSPLTDTAPDAGSLPHGHADDDSNAKEGHFVKEIRSFMSMFVGSLFDAGRSLSEEDKSRFGKLCESEAGRLWFARTLDRHRSNTMQVADVTFFRLMQFVSVALNECTLADDFGPAKILMNMCFTFYRLHEGDEREYLHTQLSSQPIWQSLRFWQAALFNSVAHERSRKRAMSGGNKWSQLSDTQREESIVSDSNIVFGQLGTFTANMLSLGVPREACEHFLEKMAVIGDLGDEQKALLFDNIERLSPRVLRITLERDRLIGFGFALRIVDGVVKVSSVLPLSPAARCGRMRTGDVVVSINGQSCDGMISQALVRTVKGLGHTVTLELKDVPSALSD
eukprot:Opistho-2@18346